MTQPDRYHESAKHQAMILAKELAQALGDNLWTEGIHLTIADQLGPHLSERDRRQIALQAVISTRQHTKKPPPRKEGES